MNLQTCVIAFFLLPAACGLAAAQPAGRDASQPAVPHAGQHAWRPTGRGPGAAVEQGADRARLDRLRAQGYEALYNLDYEGARRFFREMAQAFPDHPAGPQCLASTVWLEEMNRARHLQASLYSTESFAARADDKAAPATIEQFRRWVGEAKALSEARLRRDRGDVEALYFLGAAEGLKSVFAAAVERRFLDALRDGSDAADLHRQVLKLDPSYHDAELTVGMHNYIVGSLPLPVKLLASVGGMRGSKKRGLETIERVAREGRWARDIARLLLIDLYKREKRWAEAAAVAGELAARYPRNHLLQLQAADALVAQAVTLRRARGADASAGAAEERQALGIFESLLRERVRRGGGAAQAGAADTAAAQTAADLIHFRYSEALLALGQPERAVKEYLSTAARPAAAPAFATLARLRAAQALDLAGRRQEALAEYRAVLDRPNVHHSHKEAKRGLREPYRQQGQESR